MVNEMIENFHGSLRTIAANDPEKIFSREAARPFLSLQTAVENKDADCKKLCDESTLFAQISKFAREAVYPSDEEPSKNTYLTACLLAGQLKAFNLNMADYDAACIKQLREDLNNIHSSERVLMGNPGDYYSYACFYLCLDGLFSELIKRAKPGITSVLSDLNEYMRNVFRKKAPIGDYAYLAVAASLISTML